MQMPYYFNRFQFLVAVLVLTDLSEVVGPMQGNGIVTQRRTGVK